MEISNIDVSTLLNMIDTFYNNARNKLVLFGGLIILIVGIVLPAILQWASQGIQKGKNIEMENKLRKELTNSINLKGKSIEEKNRNIIDNYFEEKEMEIKKISDSLEKRISLSIALNFYNMGAENEKAGYFYDAIRYYISAGEGFIEASDEGYLNMMLSNIKKCCLNINKIKDQYEIDEVKKSLDGFISELEEKYADNRYFIEIKEIKKSYYTGSKVTKI